jgi:hypothetical protein
MTTIVQGASSTSTADETIGDIRYQNIWKTIRAYALAMALAIALMSAVSVATFWWYNHEELEKLHMQIVNLSANAAAQQVQLEQQRLELQESAVRRRRNQMLRNNTFPQQVSDAELRSDEVNARTNIGVRPQQQIDEQQLRQLEDSLRRRRRLHMQQASLTPEEAQALGLEKQQQGINADRQMIDAEQQQLQRFKEERQFQQSEEEQRLNRSDGEQLLQRYQQFEDERDQRLIAQDAKIEREQEELEAEFGEQMQQHLKVRREQHSLFLSLPYLDANDLSLVCRQSRAWNADARHDVYWESIVLQRWPGSAALQAVRGDCFEFYCRRRRLEEVDMLWPIQGAVPNPDRYSMLVELSIGQRPVHSSLLELIVQDGYLIASPGQHFEQISVEEGDPEGIDNLRLSATAAERRQQTDANLQRFDLCVLGVRLSRLGELPLYQCYGGATLSSTLLRFFSAPTVSAPLCRFQEP